MNKPATVEGPLDTVRWMAGQAWRDLMSVYYANTPVWRWLKSGALVFFGLFTWAGAAVVLSVQPAWAALSVVMAYGFLLIFWGPLTHMLLVPAILRLRRTASRPATRWLGRHGSKLNIAIFVTLVAMLAVAQPGFMLLEFSPSGVSGETNVNGEIHCTTTGDGSITCEVDEPAGFDHVVVRSGDAVIARADEPPYTLEFHRDDVVGDRYLVQMRDENGNHLRTVSREV